MNLRQDLPQFDTPELAAQWSDAHAILARVGELDIPCAMGVGTRRILFQAIRAMGASEVLDIGTYCGTSALAFALAVGEAGHVTTVDIKDANEGDAHWRLAKRPRSPAALMSLAGVAERVEFVTMDAREYLKTTTRKFDLISVDGWHEAHAVESEVRLALDHLNPGGLIFLDDVHVAGAPIPPGLDRIDGPRVAIERMLRARMPFRVCPVSASLEGEWLACAFLVATC